MNERYIYIYIYTLSCYKKRSLPYFHFQNPLFRNCRNFPFPRVIMALQLVHANTSSPDDRQHALRHMTKSAQIGTIQSRAMTCGEVRRNLGSKPRFNLCVPIGAIALILICDKARVSGTNNSVTLYIRATGNRGPMVLRWLSKQVE